MPFEEALLMTKQGIRLRLQAARRTRALKGQLPDLPAKAAAGGLLSAPFHSRLPMGRCYCARRRRREAHVERAESGYAAPRWGPPSFHLAASGNR